MVHYTMKYYTSVNKNEKGLLRIHCSVKKAKCKKVCIVGDQNLKQEGSIREYTCICSFVEKTYRKKKTETREIDYIQELVRKGQK